MDLDDVGDALSAELGLVRTRGLSLIFRPGLITPRLHPTRERTASDNVAQESEVLWVACSLLVSQVFYRGDACEIVPFPEVM